MCGIAGVVSRVSPDRNISFDSIGRMMANALEHRGPDDCGVWSDASGVTLAHRRLSIVELSNAGHQPMASASARFIIAFNGEIYNHLEVRHALAAAGKAPAWRGSSDTETLLACFDEWGIESTLKKTVGMFAMAIWDQEKRSLLLARDRFGEKPLYYGWNNHNFLFGSELKALAVHPEWCGEIDRRSLCEYVRYGYVPTPYSIWSGINKLLPGAYVVLSCHDMANPTLSEPVVYWQAQDFINKRSTEHLNDTQAIDSLDRLLRQSISGQMIADVPLGAFLSGGIDSSTIVALMQTQSAIPVRTFTIGFTENDYNEAIYAKAVAEHLGTDHSELYVSPKDALELIPRLPTMYDEPFADASQLPTHLVAILARKHVTVSLSGDGGDELFGGYNRHVFGPKLWQRMHLIPTPARRWFGEIVKKISPTEWNKLGSFLPSALRQPTLGDKAHKLAGLMLARGPEDIYQWLVSFERNAESLVLGLSPIAMRRGSWAEVEMQNLGCTDVGERMMFNDIVGYMTDDILCKVDRAAMAVGLEVRVPFLDHRLAEFALQLPTNMKVRAGQGKWLTRQVLSRYVPAALFERPKQGFAVPIDTWLRGPLRDWAETLLEPQRMRREGFFDAMAVQKKWNEHLSGRRNWQYWLWNILMFQSWHERWCVKPNAQD
jgi:asparagine synthase (glutamine-hydrolysing)